MTKRASELMDEIEWPEAPTQVQLCGGFSAMMTTADRNAWHEHCLGDEAARLRYSQILTLYAALKMDASQVTAETLLEAEAAMFKLAKAWWEARVAERRAAREARKLSS